MPRRRNVVQFVYPRAFRPRSVPWWLIVDPQEGVDLCSIDPRLRCRSFYRGRRPCATMTRFWMGLDTVRCLRLEAVRMAA